MLTGKLKHSDFVNSILIEVIDFNHSFYHSIGWKNIVPGIVCPYIFVIVYRFIFINLPDRYMQGNL